MTDEAMLRKRCEVARAGGDRRAEVESLLELGHVACEKKDCTASRAYYEEALAAAQAGGDALSEANGWFGLGQMYRASGQLKMARKPFEKALAIYRALGERAGELQSLVESAHALAFGFSDYKAAQARYEEALALYRIQGDRPGEVKVLEYLGSMYQALSHAISIPSGYEFKDKSLGGLPELYAAADSALARYREAMLVCRTLGDRQGEARMLNMQGDVHAYLIGPCMDVILRESIPTFWQAIWNRLRGVDPFGEAKAAHGVADEGAAALALYKEALAIYQELGDQKRAGWMLEEIKEVQSLMGRRGGPLKRKT